MSNNGYNESDAYLRYKLQQERNKYFRYMATRSVPAKDPMEFKDYSRANEGSDHTHPNMFCHRGKK